MASTDHDEIPWEKIRSVLTDYPVNLAVLFGSQARGEAGQGSDIDIAVSLDETDSGEGFDSSSLLTLGADLDSILSTQVDVIELRSVDPFLACHALEEGVLIVGDPDQLESIRSEISQQVNLDGTPRERFDAALSRINDVLA